MPEIRTTSPPPRRKAQPSSPPTAHYHKVYRADRRATMIITIGGYGIIASIMAILLFLIYQSLPLAKGASVKELLSVPLSDGKDRALLTGIDPFMEVFYTVNEKGQIRFYRVSDKRRLMEKQLPLDEQETIVSASKGSLSREVFAVGTDAGHILTVEIEMNPKYTGGEREIIPSLEILEVWEDSSSTDISGRGISRLVFRQNEDLSRFWSWVDGSGRSFLRIVDGDDGEQYRHELSGQFEGSPLTALTISYNGENLIAATEAGKLYWFNISDFESIVLKDSWRPFLMPVSAMNYLLGDQALVLGSPGGAVEMWFPVRTSANFFKFQRIQRFDSHSRPVSQIYSSPRNRNFLTIDAGGSAYLHYSTTGKTQLKFKPADFPITAASFSPKSNGILVIDARKQFSLYELDNPHPEATFGTLFKKVWYEGYPNKEFVWQSTGGSDEFEPKLSLIPLIFGTLKGTLYAMLFSVPIALLAAIYVSQFAPSRLARVIKPTVEIMAALPSVVIGFLAGLYFSPVFEKYLIPALVFILLLPVLFFLGILLWKYVPEHLRMQVPPGWELLFSIPVIILTLWSSALLAHPLENLFFGGNFQQWLFAETGITYQTRNSMVVGFALGFAVIPIIFTVSEDALSNVPESLTSASLALSASRWQTVRRVVLPAASGGIFAATMLGLGRAVGETMIVLMATGNTPILDLLPFNGFRAMSAAIAVEIPEAPVGGTLYRVLFLTALLLFVFTFFVNTLSSLIGERLRKKYARF